MVILHLRFRESSSSWLKEIVLLHFKLSYFYKVSKNSQQQMEVLALKLSNGSQHITIIFSDIEVKTTLYN